ncbi:MAG TPA: asparagine synthase (glutamine-hydrolyzing) [bacterium]|nr:asparagine synthase (glutamine-hydrolyzing) [bacterium]
MCGLSGIISLAPDEIISECLDRMIQAQTHRGPDSDGKWLQRYNGAQIGFGHTRLAIFDLTDAGNQPVRSEDGPYALIYNGAIYNYLELRAELEAHGVRFHTRCDTEVVFQCLIAWGEKAFAKFNGMWALAFLDRKSEKLLLSRDHFGIKPLYYHQSSPKRLVFASEIKAILKCSGERFEVSAPAVERFLLQSLLDAQEETFFKGVKSLPPAHFASVDLSAPSKNLEIKIERYWSPEVVEPARRSEADLIEEVRATFSDAVRIRLQGDVPVGVLLSGGLDSSSIAAAMNSISGGKTPLSVLSAVSGDPRFDESPFIRKMIDHLGPSTRVFLKKLKAEEAFDLLDTVTWFNDEPANSFSNVSHYLLMEEAKNRGITVVLSGQGADELLCGYSKYLGFYVQSLVQRGKWYSAARVLAEFVGRRTVLPQMRIQEAKRYLPKALCPKEIDIRGPLIGRNGSHLNVGLNGGGVVQRQVDDIYRYSVPALVHYEDRMSMSFSREIRLPFLDHRLVTLLLPLSPSLKLSRGWTKWIFRKAMEGSLPKEITWRKDKKGFTSPESEWLKRELNGRVRALFDGEMLASKFGFIDQAGLRKRYEAYCRQLPEKGSIGCKDIFNMISLELWLRRFENHLKAA